MARFSESMVSLRIFGDALRPDEITALLGAKPSLCYCKGDLLSTRSGTEFRRKTGMWSLIAEVRTAENVDEQVGEIFAQLPLEISVLSDLSEKFKVELFCGLFMNAWNEGLSLNISTLRALAERGVEIGFDVYGPADESLD